MRLVAVARKAGAQVASVGDPELSRPAGFGPGRRRFRLRRRSAQADAGSRSSFAPGRFSQRALDRAGHGAGGSPEPLRLPARHHAVLEAVGRAGDPLRRGEVRPRPGPFPRTRACSPATGHMSSTSNWKTPLRASFPTLAEYLGSHGYATAGFVGNTQYCSYDTGLDRGFTHYEDYVIDIEHLRPLRTAVLFELAWDGLSRLGMWLSQSRYQPVLHWFLAPDRKDAGAINREFTRLVVPPAGSATPVFRFSQLLRRALALPSPGRDQVPLWSGPSDRDRFPGPGRALEGDRQAEVEPVLYRPDSRLLRQLPRVSGLAAG